MAMEDRVSRLERQNRRLKRTMAAVALVVVSAVIMGATRQTKLGEVVEAQAFAVKDKSGKLRAVLGFTDGMATLSLFDANQKRRVGLSVGKNGAPVLSLFDTDGKPRAALSVGKNGAPVLGFYDANRKLRVGLSVGTSGAPVLGFYDANRKQRVSLGLGKSSDPSLIFRDTNRRNRITIAVLPGGTGTMTLYNASGKARWGKAGR